MGIGGGAPPGPLVHTPAHRSTVPYGQLLAAAGDATASDPKTAAKVQKPIRIGRFTGKTLAAGQPALTDRPALCRSLHASTTRSLMEASAFFR